MFTVKYTCADGAVRYDFHNTFAGAMFCALETPIEGAVRAEVTGPDGRVWSYRLKGW